MTTRADMVAAVERAAATEAGLSQADHALGLRAQAAERAQQAAALRAAAEALAAEEWRPIADCPEEWKDGREVLVRIEHENYRHAIGADKRQWEQIATASWTKHNNGGWVWHGIFGTVTHVCPLPAPPAEGG